MNQITDNKQENLVLTEQQTLEQVVNCLNKNISVNSTDKFDTNSLFQILVRAASRHDTIENSCQELKQATCGNNIRYNLQKRKALEKEINVALKEKIPKGLKNNSLNLAIDFNLISYYGQPNEEEKPYICRSQAKNGTCSFYGYALAICHQKGKTSNFSHNSPLEVKKRRFVF